VIDEDKCLETFGIAKKIQKILREQQGEVQTRKQAQQQQQQQDIVSKEQRTKKRCEESRPSCPI